MLNAPPTPPAPPRGGGQALATPAGRRGGRGAARGAKAKASGGTRSRSRGVGWSVMECLSMFVFGGFLGGLENSYSFSYLK